MSKEEQQIVEQVTDGSSITRKWMGFKDHEILFPVGGAVASAFLFFLRNLGFSSPILFAIVPIPFFLSMLVLFLFVYRKPPHFAADWYDGIINGRHYSPAIRRSFSLAPDGMFGKNIIIWGDLNKGSWSAGVELAVPPFDYSNVPEKNRFKERLDGLLNFLSREGLRTQFFWTVDSDYSREIDQYEADTETLPQDSICYKYRQERLDFCRKATASRSLRREKLLLFISAPLTKSISGNLSSAGYDAAAAAIMDDVETTAHRHLQRVQSYIETCGVNSLILDAKGLCDALRMYYNPALSLANFHVESNNFEMSVKEQILFSDLKPSEEFSFVLDNHFYTMFALQSPLPKQVYLGMINDLTKLGILDYNITVNIIPCDINKAISKEEHAINVLEGQLQERKAPASLNHIHRQRHEMVRELMDGHSSPMDCQFFISVHAPDTEELHIKATSIKAALARIGIGYYVLTEPKGAINAFFQATPGWMWGARPNHCIRTLNKYISCLVPFSATYTGQLDHAEALYCGEQKNLVGVKQFAANICEDSDPQHGIIFGKTGSGKSVLTADLIMQTHGFYDFTCIIDYGLSYAALAKQFGVKPIFLSPSSNITINYFDTRGLPLTGEHMSLTAIVLRVMCDGLASDGMIMRYLVPFYYDFASEWLANHIECQFELACIAMVQDDLLSSRKCDDEIEAWKMAVATWSDAGITDKQVAEYMFKFNNRKKVYAQCYARFKPEDFPTHFLFVNYLRSKPLPDEENPQLLQEVSDSLELWQASGKNGRLFDGISNLDLSSNFQYFELSKVPANDHNFKFVAGALIQMVAMSRIELMDRSKKKRLVIDEANSFFEIPQGAKVIESAMTKYRKHRCSVLISFQQYEMLDSKGIKESVLSNIHQYLLMGQSDRHDVDKLGDALGLSESIKEAVLNFDTPANLPIDDRYSAFTQITKHGGIRGGVCRNYMTSKMLNMIGSK